MAVIALVLTANQTIAVIAMTPPVYGSSAPLDLPTTPTDPIDVEAVWLTPDGLLPTEIAGRKETWPVDFKYYSMLAAGILLLLTGAVVGLRIVGTTKTGVPAESVVASRVLPVETIQVDPVSSYEVSRYYTGEVASIRRSELGFEQGGEVVELLADEGEFVNKGQTLAWLDDRALGAERRQLVAKKAQAQAQLSELKTGARSEEIAIAAAAVEDLEQQLALQQTQEERRSYLYAQGAISQESLDEFSFGTNSLLAKLDQARNRLATLKNGIRQEKISSQSAAVDQIQAQIDALDIAQSKHVLSAPFSGVVARRAVDEGTVVGVGETVVELIESATPEVRIGLPSDVVSRLAPGSRQTVQIQGQPYVAQLISVLPEVNEATRTQTVVLGLEQTALGQALGQVEPGQTAQLMVSDHIQTQGYWLPLEALTEGIRGLWTCYVLVPQGEPGEFVVDARSVEVIQSDITNETNDRTNNRVFVRGTLEPDDVVVASGVHRLVAGQRVQPVADGRLLSTED